MARDRHTAQFGELHEDHPSYNTQKGSSNLVTKWQDANKTKFYMVAPTDYTDDDVTKDLDSHIRSHCKKSDEIRVHPMPGTSHIVFWGLVQLDEQGRENVSQL